MRLTMSLCAIALMCAAVILATGSGFAFAADHGPASMIAMSAAAAVDPAAMKATVGRIVHFYDVGLENGKNAYNDQHPHGINLNGQGAGPYAALVIQEFPGPYVNLLVHGWGGDWREGSVSEKGEGNASRYWVWPPKVSAGAGAAPA